MRTPATSVGQLVVEVGCILPEMGRDILSVGLFKRAQFTGLRINRGAGEGTLTKKASLIALWRQSCIADN
jgi:hypothetical protein